VEEHRHFRRLAEALEHEVYHQAEAEQERAEELKEPVEDEEESAFLLFLNI
jgi:hypothetical protein